MSHTDNTHDPNLWDRSITYWGFNLSEITCTTDADCELLLTQSMNLTSAIGITNCATGTLHPTDTLTTTQHGHILSQDVYNRLDRSMGDPVDVVYVNGRVCQCHGGFGRVGIGCQEVTTFGRARGWGYGLVVCISVYYLIVCLSYIVEELSGWRVTCRTTAKVLPTPTRHPDLASCDTRLVRSVTSDGTFLQPSVRNSSHRESISVGMERVQEHPAHCRGGCGGCGGGRGGCCGGCGGCGGGCGGRGGCGGGSGGCGGCGGGCGGRGGCVGGRCDGSDRDGGDCGDGCGCEDRRADALACGDRRTDAPRREDGDADAPRREDGDAHALACGDRRADAPRREDRHTDAPRRGEQTITVSGDGTDTPGQPPPDQRTRTLTPPPRVSHPRVRSSVQLPPIRTPPPTQILASPFSDTTTSSHDGYCVPTRHPAHITNQSSSFKLSSFHPPATLDDDADPCPSDRPSDHHPPTPVTHPPNNNNNHHHHHPSSRGFRLACPRLVFIRANTSKPTTLRQQQLRKRKLLILFLVFTQMIALLTWTIARRLPGFGYRVNPLAVNVSSYVALFCMSTSIGLIALQLASSLHVDTATSIADQTSNSAIKAVASIVAASRRRLFFAVCFFAPVHLLVALVGLNIISSALFLVQFIIVLSIFWYGIIRLEENIQQFKSSIQDLSQRNPPSFKVPTTTHHEKHHRRSTVMKHLVSKSNRLITALIPGKNRRSTLSNLQRKLKQQAVYQLLNQLEPVHRKMKAITYSLLICTMLLVFFPITESIDTYDAAQVQDLTMILGMLMSFVVSGRMLDCVVIPNKSSTIKSKTSRFPKRSSKLGRQSQEDVSSVGTLTCGY